MTEDKEFAARILSSGWKLIYEPEAIVYHAHDFGISSIFWRSRDYGLSLYQGEASLKTLHRSSIKNVLGYFFSELKYLIKMGYIRWIPYSMLYDFSRYSGTFCGKIGFTRSRFKI
jgi:rhamnosyltransferase